MTNRILLLFRRSLFVCLLGTAALASSGSAIELPPAGDLTVTVNELADGSVQFSLSGTAYLQNFVMGMTITNFHPGMYLEDAIPPNADFGSFPLPEGLKLTMPSPVPPSAPEEGEMELPPVDYPLPYVYFSGGWFLGSFSGGYHMFGDYITGSGTVIADNVPFGHFVPGTFVVTPGSYTSEPEEGSLEPSSSGVYPYYITYKVIPFSAGLDVDKPKRFPTTQVNRSSRTQRLKITNQGSLPVAGLRVINSNSSDFRVSDPQSSSLDPGESTSFTATFTPKRSGKRSSLVTITDGTSTERVRLRGKAIQVPRNSPRFPHPSN